MKYEVKSEIHNLTPKSPKCLAVVSCSFDRPIPEQNPPFIAPFSASVHGSVRVKSRGKLVFKNFPVSFCSTAAKSGVTTWGTIVREVSVAIAGGPGEGSGRKGSGFNPFGGSTPHLMSSTP